jgi:hypothetical protein
MMYGYMKRRHLDLDMREGSRWVVYQRHLWDIYVQHVTSYDGTLADSINLMLQALSYY